MNSQLIVSQNLDQRIGEAEKILTENNLKKDHPDVLWMDEEKLGVEQAKSIRQFLSLKPYSASGRMVVVLNFQNLTLDGQNSLLKTLEEPPEMATIILGASNDKKILPTILSRCEIIRLDSAAKKGVSDDIEKLRKMSVEERFNLVEKTEDKSALLDALVLYFHHQLTTNNSQLTTDFAKELLHAEQWKEANGNIRAILEYLMLKMP